MENQPEKVQSSAHEFTVHRWSRWMDGDGRLIIVVCLFGHDLAHGSRAKKVQLLNTDKEETHDMELDKFQDLVEQGKVVRINNPILV